MNYDSKNNLNQITNPQGILHSSPAKYSSSSVYKSLPNYYSNHSTSLSSLQQQKNNSKHIDSLPKRQNNVFIFNHSNSIVKCKYIVQLIQNQIQSILSFESNDAADVKIINQIKLSVSDKVKQIISWVKTTNQQERSLIIIKLLSNLAQTKQQFFLNLIPFQYIEETISYLNKQFQLSSTHEKSNSNFRDNYNKLKSFESDSYSLKHSKSISFKQNTKYSTQSQHSSKEQLIIMKSNQQNSNKKIRRKDSLKEKQKKMQIRNKKQHQHNKEEQIIKQRFLKLIQFALINKIDLIILYLLSNNNGLIFANGNKNSFSEKKKHFVLKALLKIVKEMQGALFCNRIELFSSEQQFFQYQQNIKSIKVLLQKWSIQLNENQKADKSQLIKQNQEIDNDQMKKSIEVLQKQIYQLISKQITLQQDNAGQNEPINDAKDKVLYSLSKSQGQQAKYKTINKSRSSEDNQNKTIFAFTARAFNQYANFNHDQINQANLTKQKQKSSSNSLSMHSSNHSNIKANHSNQKNKLNASFNDKSNQTKLSKPQSNYSIKKQFKGMNYNKILPLRSSVIAPRSSIFTNSIKNGCVISNQNSMHFDSMQAFGNQIYDDDFNKNFIKSGKFNQNLILTKNNRMAQRRSGFVGLTRNKESSVKRISTRWNNNLKDKDGKFLHNINSLLSDMNNQNHNSNTKVKRQMKSNFSLGRENYQRINTLAEQQDSNPSSGHISDSKLKNKQQNQSSASYIGQTYNFLKFNKSSSLKLRSRNTNLTLPSKKFVKIEEQFQQIRKKLCYVRTMMLLNLIIKDVLSAKSTKNTLLIPFLPQNRQFNFKNTQIKQQLRLLKRKAKLKKKNIIRLKSSDKKRFLKKQNKIKDILNIYLGNKQKVSQQNVKKCLKQLQLSSKNIQDFMKYQDQLIIKPFYLFADSQKTRDAISDENQQNQEETQIKFPLQIIGNNKMGKYRKCSGSVSVFQKWTQISLKYQNMSDCEDKEEEYNITGDCKNQAKPMKDQKQFFKRQKQENNYFKTESSRKKYSQSSLRKQRQDKKSLSIFQPVEDVSEKLLQFPISLIIKSTESFDRIIFQNLTILVSINQTQNHSNQQSSSGYLDSNDSLKIDGKQLKVNFQSVEQRNTKKSINLVSQDQGYLSDCEQQQKQIQLSPKQSSSGYSSSSASSTSSDSSSQSFQSSPKNTQKDFSQVQIQNDIKKQASSQQNSQNQRILRKINRTLSIDSSTEKFEKDKIAFEEDVQQQLDRGRIKHLFHQKQHKLAQQQLKQSCYDGYFSLQQQIKKLLLKYFKLEKTDMGVKLQEKKNKFLSKTSFSEVQNNLKLSLRTKLKIPKASKILKKISKQLPKQFDGLISKHSIKESSKLKIQKSDFIEFNVQIKVINNARSQKISDKKIIKQKYNIQTSKRSVFNLNQNILSILNSFEKISLIRKINNYFVVKHIITIAQRVEQQNSKNQLQIYLSEQIYCDKFHELYQCQTYSLNHILKLKQQAEDKITDSRLNKNNKQIVNFIQKKFLYLFLTEKIGSLKIYSKQKPKINAQEITLLKSEKIPNYQNYQHQSKQIDHKYDYYQNKNSKAVYSIEIEQIPENYSKTEYRNIQIIEYFSQNQHILINLGFPHLHFAKDKLGQEKIKAQCGEQETNKNNQSLGKSSLKRLNSNIVSSLNKNINKSLTKKDLKNNKSKQASNGQKYADLYFPNFQNKKHIRTTIQMNKIEQIQTMCKEFNGSTGKSKKNIAFKKKSQLSISESQSKLPTQVNDLIFQSTQKQLLQGTQRSLKSYQSKTRLHRHAHHISSIMPTSSKVVKSLKNIQMNIIDKRGKRKIYCPNLKVSLNCQEIQQKRNAKKRKNQSYDNYFDFKCYNNQVQTNQSETGKVKLNSRSNKSSLKIEKIHQNGQIQGNRKYFQTIIKRFKNFIMCNIYCKALSQFQYQLQILTGMYEKNPCSLKIIKGTVTRDFFQVIIKSNKSLENYINCQLDESFQINSNKVNRYSLRTYQNNVFPQKISAKSTQTNIQQYQYNFKNHRLIPMQKLIKTRLIGRFTKIIKNQISLKESRINNKSQHKHSIISIFLYEQIPNQQVYIHLYIPKTSKNFVFIIQGTIFYQYLKTLLDQAKDRNLNDSAKMTVEKQSQDQIFQTHKRKKPRLSIFNPLKKTSSKQVDSQKQFTGVFFQTVPSQNFPQNLKSVHTLNSIRNKCSSAWSVADQEIIQNKVKSTKFNDRQSEVNWKRIIQAIDSMKKKIRLHKYFQLKYEDQFYYLELTQNENLEKFKGIEVLCKKIHFSVSLQSYQKKIDKRINLLGNQNYSSHLYSRAKCRTSQKIEDQLIIFPTAVQLISLKYEQKKLSLLNCFSLESFSKILILQNFIKSDTKLYHSYHFSYFLQQLLLHHQSQRKRKINKQNCSLIQKNNFFKLKNQTSLIKQEDKQQKVNAFNQSSLLRKKIQLNKHSEIMNCTARAQKKLPFSKLNQPQTDSFSKTLPQFATNILISMINKGLSDSAIKKYNPLASKYKSVLYSDLLNQFRQRSQFNHFSKVKSQIKSKKGRMFYVHQNKFCVQKYQKQQVHLELQNNISLKQRSSQFRKIEYQNRNQSKTKANSGFSFFQVIFNKNKKIDRPQNRLNKVKRNHQSFISVQISNIWGETICQLSYQKIHQIYPFAYHFKNSQLKLFLKRIVKDQSIIDYLRIKQVQTFEKINR